jgi:hypothetical protein
MEALEGVVVFAEGRAGLVVFAVWVILFKARVVIGIIIFRGSG